MTLQLPHVVQPFGKQQCVCSIRAAKYRTGELRSGDSRAQSGDGVEGVEPMSSQFGPESHGRGLTP